MNSLVESGLLQLGQEGEDDAGVGFLVGREQRQLAVERIVVAADVTERDRARLPRVEMQDRLRAVRADGDEAAGTERVAERLGFRAIGEAGKGAGGGASRRLGQTGQDRLVGVPFVGQFLALVPRGPLEGLGRSGVGSGLRRPGGGLPHQGRDLVIEIVGRASLRGIVAASG